MPRCEWQNKHCDNYGYWREDQKRYLCGKHYEEKKKMQRQFNKALKKAGLSEVDFSKSNSDRQEGQYYNE